MSENQNYTTNITAEKTSTYLQNNPASDVKFSTKVKIFFIDTIVPTLLLIAALVPLIVYLSTQNGSFNENAAKTIYILFFVFLLLLWFNFLLKIVFIILLKRSLGMIICKVIYTKKDMPTNYSDIALSDLIAYCLVTIFWVLVTIITIGLFAIPFAISSHRNGQNYTERIFKITKIKK